MELPAHFKTLVKKKSKSPVQEFMDDNPHLLSSLTPANQEAYLKICSSVSHWRSKKARRFVIRIFNHIKALEDAPLKGLILGGAMRLSSRLWSFVQPYFNAVESLPQDEDFIEQWISLASLLGTMDVDVTVAFLEQTPGAIDTLGADNLLPWGEQAVEALDFGRRIWKAVKAYLEESVALQSEFAVELPRWKFFLEQAARIAELSPSAAEAFMRNGARICLLLNNQETERWVTEGLEGYCLQEVVESRNFRRKVSSELTVCAREEELIKYFSGISFKAMEKRDSLASGAVLKDRASTLALICEAYLGKRVQIRSNKSLIMVKGFTGGAATDGRTIYLPDIVSSFRLFKLMALHQSILLESGIWAKECGQKAFSPVQLHLEADKLLLERLPGLWADMERLTDGDFPPSYPSVGKDELHALMPWWGDILPELMRVTDHTIQKLKEKAASYHKLAAEVVDGLTTSMMADGERDENELWKRLQAIFDTVDFTSPEAEELEEHVKAFFYKEWDQDLSDYKMDWCLVRQRPVKDDPNVFVEEVRERLHGIITLIRRQFTRLKPERFQKFWAQPTGDALDIDALVKAIVDKRSGSFLSENVYVRRDKRIRDVAVLFLLDMSGSTEEKVQGRRVIDIQKEAMVLMAEALDSLGDPYALYGFTSEGRFRVDMFSIKEFNEPYGEQVQYRLGNVEPKELTRLGAVIRHAIYKLDGVQAAIKLLVILTDGRPYDFEYGGLDYAIADTKNAFQEAKKHRIHPFIITSDKKGASYLRRISPQTQSIVLRKVELLPTMLPAIYKRLTV